MIQTGKKFTILIDMDDTIEYLLKVWLEWLNAKYNLNVTEDDIHEYDLTKAYPTLTPEQVYEPLSHIGLWFLVKPIPGAAEAIEKLQKDGHEIYIVTSSNFQTIDVKLRYVLYKYFPMIDADHVIVARNKQMIRGDIMIDDAPHNLIGGKYLKIMMTAPHNREFNEQEYGIDRVNNWDDIVELVEWYWNLMQRLGYCKEWDINNEESPNDCILSDLYDKAHQEKMYMELAFME